MKKFFHFLTSEEFLVAFFSLIYLFFAYGPLTYQFLTPLPQNKVFLGSFGFPPDFWGNIINFQQGRLGHWLFLPKITSTLSGSPNLLKIEYRFLGQLSRFFPIDFILFFHLSRFFLSLVFLLVVYKIITEIFENKNERLAVYLLVLFSTGIGDLGKKVLNYWTPLSLFQRAAYYPHYLFAFIFSLITLLSLQKTLKFKKTKYLFLAIFFGWLVGLIHGVNLILIDLGILFSLIFLLLKSFFQPKKIYFSFIFYLIIFLIFSFFPLFYVYWVSHSYPWNLLSKHDLEFNLTSVVSPWELIWGIGPMFFLAIGGSILALKKETSWNLILFPWGFTYFLGYAFIWRLINYNAVRFLQTPFFVILAILSGLTLRKISKILNQKISPLVLAGGIIILSWPVIKFSYQINIFNFRNYGDYLYWADKQKLEAIKWLAKNSQEKDIVLADKINGELIAALAGNFVYLTHHTSELDNFSQLENNAKMFFSQQWSEKESQKFLEKEKIKYIFWGKEEKELGKKENLNYPFLEKVFENSQVVIYGFKSK